MLPQMASDEVASQLVPCSPTLHQHPQHEHQGQHDPHVASQQPQSAHCADDADTPSMSATSVSPHGGLYQCVACNKMYKKLSGLQKHMTTHTARGSEELQCNKCDKTFTSRHRYVRHSSKFHGVPTISKQYKCVVCDKVLCGMKSLSVHLRSHHRPYQCKHCPKVFDKLKKLKAHLQTHVKNEDRPHPCLDCSKAYFTAKELACHMRSHSGEKPYKCQLCGKGFSQATCLPVHMRTHTGDRPYMCSVCGQTFIQSTGLKSHLRKHTGTTYIHTYNYITLTIYTLIYVFGLILFFTLKFEWDSDLP